MRLKEAHVVPLLGNICWGCSIYNRLSSPNFLLKRVEKFCVKAEKMYFCMVENVSSCDVWCERFSMLGAKY